MTIRLARVWPAVLVLLIARTAAQQQQQHDGGGGGGACDAAGDAGTGACAAPGQRGLDAASAIKAGDAAMAEQRYLAAAGHYGKAVSLAPSDPVGHAKRATALVAQGKPFDALRDLDAAVLADVSGRAGSRLSRARIRRMVCHFDGALEDVNKVLEAKEDNGAARAELSTLLDARKALGLAQIAHASNDRESFRRHIDKVLEKCNSCAAARLLLAESMLRAGDADTAVAECGTLLKANAKDLDALLLRGLAYYVSGKVDTCLKHMREGLKYDPEHKGLKAAYRRYKNVDKAMSNGNAAAAENRQADAAASFEKAIAEMQKAANSKDGGIQINHVPRSLASAAHLGACKAHRRLGQAEKAVTACNSAIEASGNGGTAEMLVERAEAFVLQEAWERAMHDAQVAHQKDQGSGAGELYQRVQRMKQMAGRVDYYKVLGLHRGASDREIKRAYKQLALKWHPDKNPDNPEAAEKEFQKVAGAYEILSDPEKKARFDRGEDPNEQNGGGGGGGGGFHHPFGQHFGHHHHHHHGGRQRTFTFRFG
ncbi:hypothetical protein PPROV_000048200 [Pycnococcus provasolii]|uniref:J domain-containing protein n=1 Tax=Pycnococcus provasolii TaxID=41880 RepID=A0A830H3T1_9CHLO|nr:hypothetical protein PPROV_000048200 [Pycnococcus provasolii]